MRRQIGIGVIGRIITIGLGFIGAIAVARFVDAPEVYGSFFVLLAVSEAISKPVGGWVGGCRKRITERHSDEGRFFAAAWIVVGASMLAAVPVFWSIDDLVGRYVLIDSPWLALWLLFTSNVLFTNSLDILNVRENFGLGSWVDGLQGLLKYGLQIGFVLAGWGVWGMTTGFALAALAAVPLIWWFIGIRPSLPTKDTFRSAWRFARSTIPSNLLGTVMSRVDVLMLGFFASAAVVGNYQVTNKLTMVMPLIVGVASGGLLGQVSDRHSSDEAASDVIEQVVKISVVIALPVLIGGLVIGPAIVTIPFGTKYDSAFVFFLWIGLYQTLSAYNTPMSSVVQGMDRPDYSLRVRLLKSVTNIVGGVIGYYTLGPVGIVVATATAQLIATVLNTRFVLSHTEVNVLPRPIVSQVGVSLMMGLVVYGVKTQIGVAEWPQLASLVAVGGVVYGIGLLFDDWHRQLLRDIM